jgi:hypothetical protein
MTVIVVRHPAGRVDREQRRTLAQSLTDAVLEVECGVVTPEQTAADRDLIERQLLEVDLEAESCCDDVAEASVADLAPGYARSPIGTWNGPEYVAEMATLTPLELAAGHARSPIGTPSEIRSRGG